MDPVSRGSGEFRGAAQAVPRPTFPERAAGHLLGFAREPCRVPPPVLRCVPCHAVRAHPSIYAYGGRFTRKRALCARKPRGASGPCPTCSYLFCGARVDFWRLWASRTDYLCEGNAWPESSAGGSSFVRASPRSGPFKPRPFGGWLPGPSVRRALGARRLVRAGLLVLVLVDLRGLVGLLVELRPVLLEVLSISKK